MLVSQGGISESFEEVYAWSLESEICLNSVYAKMSRLSSLQFDIDWFRDSIWLSYYLAYLTIMSNTMRLFPEASLETCLVLYLTFSVENRLCHLFTCSYVSIIACSIDTFVKYVSVSILV